MQNAAEISETNWREVFLRELRSVMDFYTKATDEVKCRPPDWITLSEQLNPDRNGLSLHYRRIVCALRFCRPHEIAPPLLTDWHSATMRYFELLIRNYPEINRLNWCLSIQVNFYTLLQAELPISEGQFQDKIKSYTEKLKRNQREASGLALDLAAEEKRRREEAALSPKRTARTGGRGWKRDDTLLMKRREDSRIILAEIIRRYGKAREQGANRSWKAIALEMSRDTYYEKRMAFKTPMTWANQASAEASRRGKKSPPSGAEYLV